VNRFVRSWLRRRRRFGLWSATAERAITGAFIVRVLLVGFGLVILLMLAAGLLGVRNIYSIRATATDLLEEQVRSFDLLNAVLREQRTITAIYSTIARRPEEMDRDQLLKQLVDSDKELSEIVEDASDEPDQGLWKRLFAEASSFSDETRKLLATEGPVAGPSPRLLKTHEQVLVLVDQLVEVESRRSQDLKRQLEELSGSLLKESSVLLGGGLILALLFAFVTVLLTGKLVRQLEWQTGELSRVSWQLLEKQETTARRFSHELHDELGQSLSALKANLMPLSQAAGEGKPRIEDCIQLVDEAIRNVRELSQLLRPTILDDFGLEASLRWLCDRVQQRTGLEVTFESNFEARMADETETHLFRIAQEALTNVARHAGATEVRIHLQRLDGEVRLEIRDNGRGVQPAASTSPDSEQPRGLGIVGMRARARSAGGKLAVGSAPGEGTTVEASFPYREREEA
jgi:two-component system sensor histidine kinase UhpB